MEREVYKVGDRVVCIRENLKPYFQFEEVVEIVTLYDNDKTAEANSGYQPHNRNRSWHIDLADIVLESVYNSPVYKLLNEEK